MSSANSVQRGARIIPVGAMLASSLARMVGRVHLVREAVGRARQRAIADPVWTPLRTGLGIVGMLAPLVMLTGLGTDIHDLSWFVYYGWSSTDVPIGQAAPDAPFWLAWAVVALLALRWRRLAASAAWLALAGMIFAITTDAMLPTAQTGGWLLLALLASIGLTFAPISFRGLVDFGRRRLLMMLAAVILVLFARLLGHQYESADLVAWILLGVAAAYAARPRTTGGRWALLLLSIPAMSAIITMVVVDTVSFNIYRPSVSWPVVILAFYLAPVLVATALAAVLRPWLLAHADPHPDG